MVLLFLQILFFLQAAALDPEVVWSWPECRGLKSQWTTGDFIDLKTKGQFYRPADALNRFSVSIDRFYDWHQSNAHCSSSQKSPFDGAFNKEPNAAVLLTDKIQKKMVAKIQADLKTQENLIGNGILCTEEIIPAQHKVKCENYIKDILPSFQERLQLMRVMKSIAQNSLKPEHDKPFSNGLYAHFFPSLWKKDTVKNMSPLNEDEIILREEFLTQKGLSPELAEKIYYSLLSTTPTMLFFDQKVDAKSLNQALKKQKNQNTFDQKENLEDAKQELFFFTDYLKETLLEFPKHERGDACKVVSEVYRNLHLQYETFPKYAAMMGGLVSLQTAPFRILGREFFKGISVKMALTATALYGSMSYKDFQKYQQGVNFCSTQALGADALNSKICNFEGINRMYEGAQESAVISVLAVPATMAARALIRKIRARRGVGK